MYLIIIVSRWSFYALIVNMCHFFLIWIVSLKFIAEVVLQKVHVLFLCTFLICCILFLIYCFASTIIFYHYHFKYYFLDSLLIFNGILSFQLFHPSHITPLLFREFSPRSISLIDVISVIVCSQELAKFTITSTASSERPSYRYRCLSYYLLKLFYTSGSCNFFPSWCSSALGVKVVIPTYFFYPF